MKKYIVSIFIFLSILAINLSVKGNDWDANNKTQINAAAEVVRDKMTERKENFALVIDFVCEEGKPYQVNQVGEWILEKACSEEFSENSEHGDYLKSILTEGSTITWTSLGKEIVDNNREAFLLKLTYNLKYYSTRQQEEILNANINTWINNNIDVQNDTDIEKVKKVYKYITNNVDYDYTYQRYSAYNAFIEGEAVCNGYTMLLYKMLKMSGIEDINIVTGTAYNGENTERHAWNLVKIEGRYYYLDATWDSTLHGNTNDSVDNMTYFLKGSDFFDRNHFLEKELDSKYNISTKSYFEEKNEIIYINKTSNLKEKNVNNVSIISGINFNTKILDFINQNNFNSEYTLEIYDKNAQQVSINDLITTGTNIRLLKNNQVEKEYRIVIYGDINADGEITAYDALYLIKGVNKKIDFEDPYIIEASRIISEEGKDPSAIDALAIVKHLNKKYTINQYK